MDRLHQRKIDQQTTITDRVAGDVVAAAPHRKQKLRVPRELYSLDDIGSAHALRDDRRAAVDHRVPDGTGGFVSVLTW